METNESSEGSRSCSLDVQPSSEGLGTTSQTFSSSGGSAGSAAAAASTARAAALYTKIPVPYSEFTEPSSDSLLGTAYPRSHHIGHGSLGLEPFYVSCVGGDPGTTTDHSSSAGPVTGSSPGVGPYSGPGHGSVPHAGSGTGRGSVPCSGSGPGHASGTGHGSVLGSGPGLEPDSGPGLASGTDPGSGPGPGQLSFSTSQRLKNLKPDMHPNYTSWCHHCYSEPQKQPRWEFLQISEPGARGIRKPPEVEGKSKFLHETLPRGQCLLYNWEEERATNHLDQVPKSQDGSESFFFRHGHQGLLTEHLQSPMPSSTTQKDSYQPPRNLCRPLRGKREAILEMLLHNQICKEVLEEQEPTRKLFEVESVTHHDYQVELVQAGPPAPTKPHDYRQEQPETFWKQNAPQLPGVSNIKTWDTPFWKNCSFSTPVPLSLGHPLPYESDSYSH